MQKNKGLDPEDKKDIGLFRKLCKIVNRPTDQLKDMRAHREITLPNIGERMKNNKQRGNERMSTLLRCNECRKKEQIMIRRDNLIFQI